MCLFHTSRVRGILCDRQAGDQNSSGILRALTTALHRRIIKVSAVARIDADVFQRLAFWADIAVLFGHVGELVDAIEIRRPIRIFLHPDVSRDAALIEPLQQFAVAVAGIRGQSCGR